jgi:TolB-like protein
MIGELYYSCKTEIDQVNELRDSSWRQQGGSVDYEELSSPEIRRLEQSIQSKMQRAMSITVELKKEILNARLRLDSEGFEDEIEILDNNIEILGRELKLEPQQVLRRAMENEIAPSVQKRSLQEHLSNLFREMDLAVKPGGVVAVSGFTTRGNEAQELLSLLNEMAVVEIGRLDTLTLVERQKLAALLEEQELALSDLMDTSKAISIGRLMAADYIVTGTVVEMSTSVVIFGRIINIETGEVESVAQVIVPKDSEMKKLLA